MTAGFNRVCHLAHIRDAPFGRGKEMKDSTVVPDVVGMRREFGRGDVGRDPGDVLRCVAETRFCDFDRFFGEIKNSEVFATAREEIVYERGFSAADINEGGGANVGGAFDEGERGFEVSAIPTQRLVRLRCVDFFPMEF